MHAHVQILDLDCAAPWFGFSSSLVWIVQLFGLDSPSPWFGCVLVFNSLVWIRVNVQLLYFDVCPCPDPWFDVCLHLAPWFGCMPVSSSLVWCMPISSSLLWMVQFLGWMYAHVQLLGLGVCPCLAAWFGCLPHSYVNTNLVYLFAHQSRSSVDDEDRRSPTPPPQKPLILIHVMP